MVLNYDYGLWKSLRHEVLKMDLVNDMNMELSYGENWKWYLELKIGCLSMRN